MPRTFQNKKYLSVCEFHIMHILWNSDRPLTSTGIRSYDESLKTVTIQTCLKKLLEENYIRTSDIIQVGKSFARTFEPVVTASEYLENLFFLGESDEKQITFSKNMLHALLRGRKNRDAVIDNLISFLEGERYPK